MSDTIYVENRENIGRYYYWNDPDTKKQLKNAWVSFIDEGSNPFALEHYLSVRSFRQKQSFDDIKERINPLLKRFITRNFGYRRLTPNIPMKFIFFIEENKSEGFHTHCAFSVPSKFSGLKLDSSDVQFIKRENKVRHKVNSALNRLKYFPVNPYTSNEEIPLISDSELKRIYSLKGLVADYHQKDFWKNEDCYDERSSDFAFD